jgi:hypothetical protein
VTLSFLFSARASRTLAIAITTTYWRNDMPSKTRTPEDLKITRGKNPRYKIPDYPPGTSFDIVDPTGTFPLREGIVLTRARPNYSQLLVIYPDGKPDRIHPHTLRYAREDCYRRRRDPRIVARLLEYGFRQKKNGDFVPVKPKSRRTRKLFRGYGQG